MPRKSGDYKTKDLITPDPIYNSLLVAKFINYIMQDGKKTLAQQLFYRTMKLIEEETDEDEDPIDIFEQAVKNTMPTMEVRSRRVGGASYQVPVEVRPERRYSMAMRWILEFARQGDGRRFPQRLKEELIDASNNEGSAVNKKESVHRMAESNRAFSQFRW